MQRCGRIFWIWGIYETFDWGKTKQILHFTEVMDFIPLSYCNMCLITLQLIFVLTIPSELFGIFRRSHIRQSVFPLVRLNIDEL